MNINWREIQEIEKSLEFKHRPQGEMCFGFLDKPNQNSQLLKQILQTTLLKTQELWDKAWPGRQSSLGSHSLIWAPDFVRSPVPPQPWGLLLARTSSLMGMHPVPLTPNPAALTPHSLLDSPGCHFCSWRKESLQFTPAQPQNSSSESAPTMYFSQAAAAMKNTKTKIMETHFIGREWLGDVHFVTGLGMKGAKNSPS